MTSYSDSGVNIEIGDAASKAAFAQAIATFGVRQGLVGEPLADESGFAGLLKFGDFYLSMNCDGVGTKIEVASALNNYEGLGFDLLAMVSDDAICLGAETIAITNTFDTEKVQPRDIEAMMISLRKACIQQKVVIAGGEIAEMGSLCNGTMWNASAIGIVKKHKIIDPTSVQVGDVIISLREKGLRSNGLSLARKIVIDQFKVHLKEALEIEKATLLQEIAKDVKWQKMLKNILTPSAIYHEAVLALHGRFEEEAKVEIHGIAHITGGGIPGNIKRILKKNKLGVRLEEIYPPSEFVLELQEMGIVTDEEVYKTWNMGNGMMIAMPKSDSQKAISILKENGVDAKIAGVVTKNPQILVRNYGFFGKQKYLEFEL